MTQPAPSRSAVRTLLVRLLHEIGSIPLDKIHDQSTVDGELSMESVVFIEVQVALEDAYQIELDPVRIVELNQFDAIIDYIHDSAMSRLS